MRPAAQRAGGNRMAIIKCKMCGGDLNIEEGVSVAQCEYCGTQQTVPSAGDARKLPLFARANRLRAACEFDKAAGVYESIVAQFPEEAEAYWGLVLCRYGIEYVDDPRTGKKIPTCHRSSFDSVLDDGDFEQALENADVVARRIYREEAKLIETLRRGIVEVSGKEKPYDIFICYKETDENGNRTVDSVMAQDVYDALTKKGYRVFFSRVTLEEKLGIEYEPYIFAALNSARLMLVFGTDYEHFNAVWVKNEWNRFMMLMEAGKGKTLIPCYKGIDAYDMPKEFAKLQAQDMGKVGAMQDLLRGVDKIMGQSAADDKQASESAPQNSARPTVQSLTERAHIFLEDGDFENAGRYFDRVLDIEPKNAQAYFGKFLTQCGVHSAEELVEKATQFEIKPQNERVEVCAEDTERIEQLVEQYTVPGYLTKAEIRQELRDYDRGYSSALPYLRELMKRQKDLMDGSREFIRAEQYAKGDFAAYLAEIRKAIEEPTHLREMLDEARTEEEKTVKRISEGYREFLDEKEQSLAARFEEAIKKRDEDERKAEEDRKRAAEIERKRKMQDSIITFSVCFMLVAIVAAAMIRSNWVMSEEYKRAQELLAEGHYDEAITVFGQITSYRDSEERILSVKYAKAEALLASGDYDGAIPVFEELGDYENAPERILAAKYEKAEALLASEDYKGAIAEFENLGNYADASDRALLLLQERKEMLLALEDYAGLFAIYKERGEEIPESLLSACYKEAGVLLSAGDNARAAIRFGALGDYRDARMRSFELWNKAVERDTFIYDMCRIASYNGNILAGIVQSGKLNMIGSESVISRLKQESDTWIDLVDIAVGSGGIIGLKADGTVKRIDSSKSTMNQFSSWHDVVAVSGAEGNNTSMYYVGLKSNGTVITGFTGTTQLDTSKVRNWREVVQVCCTPEQIAVLKADGTVDSTIQKDWEEWTDIISIVALYDDLVGLKNDGTVIVESGSSGKAPRIGSTAEKIVEAWAGIVKLYGDTEPDKGFAVVMGLWQDGSILLSTGKAYPPLPEIVMDSMRVMLDSPDESEMCVRIYGLDKSGKPMVYTEDILNRWMDKKLTDQEAANEARNIIWDELDFSEWYGLKLPS